MTFPTRSGYDAATSIQLWIAARYLQAATLLAAPWLARRQLSLVGLAAAYGALTLLLILVVFAGDFPDCYVEVCSIAPSSSPPFATPS